MLGHNYDERFIPFAHSLHTTNLKNNLENGTKESKED